MVVEDITLNFDPSHRREVFRHLCRTVHASMYIYVHNAARKPQLSHGDGPDDQGPIFRGVDQVVVIITGTFLLLGLEGFFLSAGLGLKVSATAVCVILSWIHIHDIIAVFMDKNQMNQRTSPPDLIESAIAVFFAT
jgi:hypothetical protein